MLIIDRQKVEAVCAERRFHGERPKNLLDLAKMMGRSRQQVYQIMGKGRIRSDTLGEIAGHLDVGIEEITTDRPEEDDET